MSPYSDAGEQIQRYAEQLIGLLDGLDDNALWATPGGVPNSIGVLAAHLAGNLNHYLGAGVLNNGYLRDRDGEFAAHGIPQEQLAADLRAAVAVAVQAIDAVTDEMAQSQHTTPCGKDAGALGSFITRLATHFAYHVGEAYYTARMLQHD